VIREALSLSASDLPWPEAIAVGGWWNRAFQPEIDLVGADRAPVAREIYYAGSVRWLDRPFDDHDLAALQRDALAHCARAVVRDTQPVRDKSAAVVSCRRDVIETHNCWRPA
jgi:hypothetical protein